MQSGTELLIVGGGGAVGNAAIQLARLRAARITTFVRPGQEDYARRAGAQLVISSDGAAVPAIRNLHAAPFDVVIDLVSKVDALKDEAPLIKRDGVILTAIHVADEAWFRDRSLRAINIVMADTPQSSPAALEAMARLVADGSLVLSELNERPLGDANAVLERHQRRRDQRESDSTSVVPVRPFGARPRVAISIASEASARMKINTPRIS